MHKQSIYRTGELYYATGNPNYVTKGYVMLAAKHLEKKFEQPPLTVLHDVSVSFEKGVSYAIKGASGTGKSTLLHLLAGLDSPTGGVVEYNHRNIAQFDQRDHDNFLNKEIGMVFQFPYLIQELSVLENILLKGLVTGESLPELTAAGLALLDSVGIAAKAHQSPATLSGGQQQRVALARALFNKPSFLLGDEVTGNLDPDTGSTIIRLIKNAQQSWGMGVILTTHDEYVAAQMDHVFELVDGHLILVS